MQALDLLVAAIERAGYVPGADIALALDSAATEFYRDGAYYPRSRTASALTAAQMVDFYAEICANVSGRLDRGWARGRRLGRLARADGAARRDACNSSATICS